MSRESNPRALAIVSLLVGIVALPAAIWGTPLHDLLFPDEVFQDRSTELERLRREWTVQFDADFSQPGAARVFESPNGVGKLIVRNGSLLINIRDVQTGTMYYVPVSPSFSGEFLVEATATKLIGPQTGACGVIFDYRSDGDWRLLKFEGDSIKVTENENNTLPHRVHLDEATQGELDLEGPVRLGVRYNGSTLEYYVDGRLIGSQDPLRPITGVFSIAAQHTVSALHGEVTCEFSRFQVFAPPQ